VRPFASSLPTTVCAPLPVPYPPPCAPLWRASISVRAPLPVPYPPPSAPLCQFPTHHRVRPFGERCARPGRLTWLAAGGRRQWRMMTTRRSGWICPRRPSSGWTALRSSSRPMPSPKALRRRPLPRLVGGYASFLSPGFTSSVVAAGADINSRQAGFSIVALGASRWACGASATGSSPLRC
jgi:hypothetical protein